jgi:heterotetrameric sarcosine oxidase gamma subunit
VTDLAFLSPDRAAARARRASPLARALASAPSEVRDRSRELAKIEVRGDHAALETGAEVVRLAPRRALVLAPYAEGAALRAELAQRFAVVDLTGALAALAVTGPRAERALRRMTELDLDALPAVGSVARVRCVVLRDGPDAFRLLVAQELGHYLAHVVLDALA